MAAVVQSRDRIARPLRLSDTQVVLGLIFLKYISDSFTELHEKLKKDKLSDPEDMDEYVSRTIFWVPKEARWEHLQNPGRI